MLFQTNFYPSSLCLVPRLTSIDSINQTFLPLLSFGFSQWEAPLRKQRMGKERSQNMYSFGTTKRTYIAGGVDLK